MLELVVRFRLLIVSCVLGNKPTSHGRWGFIREVEIDDWDHNDDGQWAIGSFKLLSENKRPLKKFQWP